MNPASKSPLSVMLDPVAAEIIAQLQQQLDAKDQEIMRGQQALATTEMLVLKLKEELRLERIGKYGKRSEKLSDLRVSRTRALARGAVPKMEVGLPKSACRSRLQTARCCCVPKRRGSERPRKKKASDQEVRCVWSR